MIKTEKSTKSAEVGLKNFITKQQPKLEIKGYRANFYFLCFINILWNCIQGHNYDCNTSCNASICSNNHGQTYHEGLIVTSQTIIVHSQTDPCPGKIEICSITL